MKRIFYIVPLVACALLLAYGYYLQYAQGLNPCPLCLVQRGFFYLVIATFLLAAIHGPQAIGARVYPVFAALFALGGAATAARQVWLQSLPADQVPACGPDLAFMLQNFPLSRVVEKLFAGSGECAAVDWNFLGLSIAGWSLAWFAILIAYAVWLELRALRRTPAAS